MVLRVYVLLLSVESDVPIKHVPEELRQPVIPKREMWKR